MSLVEAVEVVMLVVSVSPGLNTAAILFITFFLGLSIVMASFSLIIVVMVLVVLVV